MSNRSWIDVLYNVLTTEAVLSLILLLYIVIEARNPTSYRSIAVRSRRSTTRDGTGYWYCSVGLALSYNQVVPRLLLSCSFTLYSTREGYCTLYQYSSTADMAIAVVMMSCLMGGGFRNHGAPHRLNWYSTTESKQSVTPV